MCVFLERYVCRLSAHLLSLLLLGFQDLLIFLRLFVAHLSNTTVDLLVNNPTAVVGQESFSSITRRLLVEDHFFDPTSAITRALLTLESTSSFHRSTEMCKVPFFCLHTAFRSKFPMRTTPLGWYANQRRIIALPQDPEYLPRAETYDRLREEPTFGEFVLPILICARFLPLPLAHTHSDSAAIDK